MAKKTLKLERGTIYQKQEKGTFYFRFQVNGERKAISLKTKSFKEAQEKAKKRGRPKKGEERPKDKTVVERQFDQTFEENLSGLPKHCNKGNNRNSNGYNSSWKGDKLHIDCIDGDIPAS